MELMHQHTPSAVQLEQLQIKHNSWSSLKSWNSNYLGKVKFVDRFFYPNNSIIEIESCSYNATT